MLAETFDQQYEIIGDRVHTLRRKMTPRPDQRSLSLKAGLGENRVNQIENNNRSAKIRVDELYALADALGCDVNYLIGATDDPGGGGSRSQKAWSANTPMSPMPHPDSDPLPLAA